MKNIIIIFLTMIVCYQNLLSEKRALIIAIGNYKNGWKKINSFNDTLLLKNTLIKQGFAPNNIKILKDEEATKNGIIKSFRQLENNSNKGDILFIHFSAHGDQIKDKNNDEIDGMDEVIITWDSRPKRFKDYSNYLIDDELGELLESLQSKIGKEGHILVTIDACHSGTMTRGGNDFPIYIETDGYVTEKNKSITKDDIGKLIVFSGSRFDKLNYEYDKANIENKIDTVGSLTWCFTKAIENITEPVSYRVLFKKILEEYNKIGLIDQIPMAEGNLDLEVFSGNLILNKPYFTIDRFISDDRIIIKAGSIFGISKEDSIEIHDKPKTDLSQGNLLTKGIVDDVNIYFSTLKLDKPIQDRNIYKYYCYQASKSTKDFDTKIKLNNNIPKSIFNTINTKLAHSKFIVIDSSNNVDFEIQYQKNKLLRLLNNKTNEEFIFSKIDSEIDSVIQILDNYSIINFLDKLANFLSSNPLKLEFEYIPLVDTLFNKNLADINFSVKCSSAAKLKIINRTSKDLYFNALEVYPDKKIKKLEGLNPEELLVKNKDTLELKNISFYEPLGKYKLYFFTTPYPLDLSNLVDNITSRTRGNQNLTNLENLLTGISKEIKTRGQEVKKPDNININDGSIQILYYKIEK